MTGTTGAGDFAAQLVQQVLGNVGSVAPARARDGVRDLLLAENRNLVEVALPDSAEVSLRDAQLLPITYYDQMHLDEPRHLSRALTTSSIAVLEREIAAYQAELERTAWPWASDSWPGELLLSSGWWSRTDASARKGEFSCTRPSTHFAPGDSFLNSGPIKLATALQRASQTFR
jgi:hypothetical protein